MGLATESNQIVIFYQWQTNCPVTDGRWTLFWRAMQLGWRWNPPSNQSPPTPQNKPKTNTTSSANQTLCHSQWSAQEIKVVCWREIHKNKNKVKRAGKQLVLLSLARTWKVSLAKGFTGNTLAVSYENGWECLMYCSDCHLWKPIVRARFVRFYEG